MRNTRIYFISAGNDFYLQYDASSEIYSWDQDTFYSNVQDAITAARRNGIKEIFCNLKGLPK